jgi:hypothetical protein
MAVAALQASQESRHEGSTQAADMQSGTCFCADVNAAAGIQMLFGNWYHWNIQPADEGPAFSCMSPMQQMLPETVLQI